MLDDGETVILRLTNRSGHPLKVAVLDLEPTWEISQIPLGGLESPFFPLDHDVSEDVTLRITIPDDAAYQQVTETLKVFAVHKGLADFR